MGSPAEREMRDEVANHLRRELPGYRIVHELVMGYTARADLVAIGRDRIIAVELKSSRDTLKRAEKQVVAFRALSHATVLVLDQKFFDRRPYRNGEARCAAPSVAGRPEIWHYPRPAPDADYYGGAGMYQWIVPRPPAGPQRQPCAFDFLGLLWRSELVAEAERHGIAAPRNLNMSKITAAMVWQMTGREIAEAVCRQLRARRFPEADPPLSAAARVGRVIRQRGVER